MIKQPKTLQEHYNLIKKGKGNKQIFLKEAKSLFPNLISNLATYEQAENRLKQRAIISENVFVVGNKPKENPEWFKIFEEKYKYQGGWDSAADVPPNVEGE